jgi:SAM-dependent methyltransferase
MIEVGTHPTEDTGGEGQTVEVTDDAALYGDSFADVYDEWYRDMFDTTGAVHALVRFAQCGTVCELGVGTGRLAIPLAETGLEVVGIDASEAMLEALAAKNPPTSLRTVLGDMSEIADLIAAKGLPGEFSLVFCAFNTFLNLTTADAQQRCVTEVASMLGPGGRFVVENIVPAEPADMRDEIGAISTVHSDVPVLTSSTVDTDAQVITGEHLEQQPGGVRRRPWKVRYVTIDQLDRFAHSAGLRLEQRWSDWQRSPFDEHSEVSISIYLADAQDPQIHAQRD